RAVRRAGARLRARERPGRRQAARVERVRRAQLAALWTRCGSRVERQPAVAAEPGLDPRVRGVVGDAPDAALRVVRPARKADDDTRGDAEIAEHQRHRAGEVLAVARARA